LEEVEDRVSQARVLDVAVATPRDRQELRGAERIGQIVLAPGLREEAALGPRVELEVGDRDGVQGVEAFPAVAVGLEVVSYPPDVQILGPGRIEHHDEEFRIAALEIRQHRVVAGATPAFAALREAVSLGVRGMAGAGEPGRRQGQQCDQEPDGRAQGDGLR
jgi:hypothetical protein